MRVFFLSGLFGHVAWEVLVLLVVWACYALAFRKKKTNTKNPQADCGVSAARRDRTGCPPDEGRDLEGDVSAGLLLMCHHISLPADVPVPLKPTSPVHKELDAFQDKKHSVPATLVDLKPVCALGVQTLMRLFRRNRRGSDIV